MLIFFSLICSIQTLSAQECFDRVVKVIESMGPASDQEYRIKPEPKLLAAGEVLLDFYGNSLVSYNKDKLLYFFSGSYHSGWFEEVAVVNPKTCWVVDFVNIYSE